MTEDLRAENERLKASNNKLAQMLKNMGDKLDEAFSAGVPSGGKELAAAVRRTTLQTQRRTTARL